MMLKKAKKRPPADGVDDLFFVWNHEIQDLEKMLLPVVAPSPTFLPLF